MHSDTFSSCLLVTVQRGIRSRDLESLCFSPLNIQTKDKSIFLLHGLIYGSSRTLQGSGCHYRRWGFKALLSLPELSLFSACP